MTGLTAFDFIMDYDEWIECGHFTDEIRARLKGEYNLDVGSKSMNITSPSEVKVIIGPICLSIYPSSLTGGTL